MLERDVPDREGLKLGVPGFDSAFILMVELGEAGGHLAAAGSGGSHNHQGLGGFDIIILAVALVADDQRHVAGIAVNGIVAVHADSHVLQLVLKQIRAGLPGIMCDDHASHIQALIRKRLDEAEDINVIGDPEIRADLIFFNIRSADDYHNLRLIGELQKHRKLAVRRKARKDARCVIIVKQFASEFQIELIPKLVNPFPDMVRLHF